MNRDRDDVRVQRGHRQEAEARSREQGFEQRDAPIRPIVIAMLGFGALMLLGLTVPILLVAVAGGGDSHRLDRIQPPPPKLLADPRGQRVRLDVMEYRALHAGREPIDRAMQDVARRGWDKGSGRRP